MKRKHIIQTRDLTRTFKNTCAVDALNLDIKQGDLFGLVGPDGAGKTTTLRLLAGLLNITSGVAEVAGCDMGAESERIKPKIGYMAQRFSLYGTLSVSENLHFFAEIYHVPVDDLAERTESLLDFAGLLEFKERRAAHLSGGMQKKLALACTLIHQPEILLLDEPTTGVDPISRREFWRILSELHISGTTILVSTPYMDEADRCTRVGLMYEGSLVTCDSPDRIRSKLKAELISVFPADWQKARLLPHDIPGVIEVQTYGEALHILVDSAEKRMPGVKKYYRKNKIPIHSMRSAPLQMEEAFISRIRLMESERSAVKPEKGG